MGDRLRNGMIEVTVMGDTCQIINVQRLKRLLHRIVDIYSRSGKEEELVDYLRGYLKRQGLPVILQEVDDHLHNVLVIPPEIDIQMALVGHLDTMAAYELEEYGYSEQGDQIMGLGTADMKSGFAAMVIEYVHAPHEAVSFMRVGKAAEIYAELILRLA